MQKKKKSPLQKIRNECDALMQELGKLKYPRSLISNLPTEVMHHFIPKSTSSILRYNWDNLIPLTNGEHCRIHQSGDPTYECTIISKKGGLDWFNKLKLKSRETQKVNIEYYQKVKKDFEDEISKIKTQ